MGYTWEEICNDPESAELPHKIESDRWGNIVMSPPPEAAHSGFQGEIIIRLLRLMRGGYAQPRYPLETIDGVKSIDVVWVSRARRRTTPKASLVHLVAPEICVEILSRNERHAEVKEKHGLYFERGATECWMCNKNGRVVINCVLPRV